jgi:hypothetical protein
VNGQIMSGEDSQDLLNKLYDELKWYGLSK